jgi:hypothetical protein
MNADFGQLVDFLRGELNAAEAAQLRARLEQDEALFAMFERLRHTYAVLRSMPMVGIRESGFGNRSDEFAPIPDTEARFLADLRSQFETRGLAGLIPCIAASPGYLRTLRVEFSVRVICASLPQLLVGDSVLAALRAEFGARALVDSLPFLKARPAWIRALREDFRVRSLVGSIPLLQLRPEFVAALRAEFGQRALVGSVPDMEVRAGFERRLKVALVEAQREVAPAEAAVLAPVGLPKVEASDPFRRRLFKKILLNSRRRVREEPQRVDVDEYQWGREMRSGLKDARRSLAFTFTVHALAIAIMLFVFASPYSADVQPYIARGDAETVAVPALPSGEMGERRVREPEQITLPAATAEDWSPLNAELPVGTGGGELPDNERRVEEDLPAPPEPQIGQEQVLGFMDRDGASSFFRLRGLSKQEKIDYLGSAELYDALDRTLAWLARAQQLSADRDGSWGNPMSVGAPRENAKIEMTSAALLAFLGDGHSSQRSPEEKYSFAVKRGIAWLLECQNDDGQIGSPEQRNVLVHAMATLALAEEFGLTRRNDLREPLRKACRWLCAVKAEGGGGFPFKLDQPADMSTSVWAYMALATARNVKVPPIDLPQERIDLFLDWYKAQTRDGKPLNSTMVLGHELLADSSAASLALFATEAELDTRANNYLQRVNREAPNLAAPGNRERDNGDVRYLFFGSMSQALNHQRAGTKPGEWYAAFSKTLRENQRPDGTWAVTSDYASLYGDEYTAAMACLSIENAYRVSILK